MNRPWIRRASSTGLRSFGHLLRRRRWRHRRLGTAARLGSARQRWAQPPSTVNAVGDAAEHVFDFTDSRVGVELVEGAATAESAVWSLEPLRRFFLITERIYRVCVDLR